MFKVKTIKLNEYEMMIVSNLLQGEISRLEESDDDIVLQHLDEKIAELEKIQKKFEYGDLFVKTPKEYLEALEYETNG